MAKSSPLRLAYCLCTHDTAVIYYARGIMTLNGLQRRETEASVAENADDICEQCFFFVLVVEKYRGNFILYVKCPFPSIEKKVTL